MRRIAGVAATLIAALFGMLPPTGWSKEPQAQVPVSTAEEQLARGDAAWRAGRLDTAVFHYLKADTLEPASDIALLRLGALHESAGRRDLAIRLWRLAAARNPRNGLTWQRLGFARLAETDPGTAAGDFARALEIDAGLWRAHLGAALAAETLADLTAAQRHLDTALALQPSSAELLGHSARIALRLGHGQRARREAGAALVLAPNLPIARLVVGDLQALEGDYAAALEAYHRVLAEAPAYERLGERALERGDTHRAVQFFDEAIETSPVHLESARQRRAVARERLGTLPVLDTSPVKE